MVFVGSKHPIYTEADKKTPKRVGNLVKSSSASLHGMLMTHKEEVQNFISGLVKGVWGVDLTRPDSPPELNEVDMAMEPVDYLSRPDIVWP